MALTTTTIQTDRILAEVIASQVLPGAYPTLVYANLCNYDMDLVGAPSPTKAYPRLADDGAATTVAENADANTITTASLGTQLTVTPSQYYARFDVTEATLKQRMPGLAPSAVRGVIDSGDVGAMLTLFGEEVLRARKMLFESLEVALAALADDFSTSVGSTGVNLALTDLESAIHQLTLKETGAVDRWVFTFDPIQLSDIRREIALTSGGMGGGVWSGDIQSIMSVKPSLAVDGLQGALFGIPVYVTANSINPSPNGGNDEAGALFVRGIGHPERGQPGAFVCAISDEFHPRFDADVSGRLCEVYGFMSMGFGERADDMGISIISDA